MNNYDVFLGNDFISPKMDLTPNLNVSRFITTLNMTTRFSTMRWDFARHGHHTDACQSEVIADHICRGISWLVVRVISKVSGVVQWELIPRLQRSLQLWYELLHPRHSIFLKLAEYLQTDLVSMTCAAACYIDGAIASKTAFNPHPPISPPSLPVLYHLGSNWWFNQDQE